jgi:hypothetical protein
MAVLWLAAPMAISSQYKIGGSMPDEEAIPVIIFVASLYAFAIVLVYVLARAWEQALSTRPLQSRAASTRRQRDGRTGRK